MAWTICTLQRNASWARNMLLQLLLAIPSLPPPWPLLLLLWLTITMLTLLSWALLLWLRSAWYYLHGHLCAMAEENYSSKLLLLYFILLPMIIYYLCSITYVFLTAVERNSHRGLSRRLYYHNSFRPKHQYRYHWFKACMKQKKRRKFRKPMPLFHLKTKGKLIIGIYLFVIRLNRVGCCVSKQIQWLCSCLCSFFYHKPKEQCDILK